MGSFTYIAEGSVIHIHCRGWGHSHTLQRVGSFTYIVEGGDIHIHCRGWGHSHTLQRVGSFIYIAEGVVIHIHCRGWGHSHKLQRVGTTPAAVVLIICTCHSDLHGLYGATIFIGSVVASLYRLRMASATRISLGVAALCRGVIKWLQRGFLFHL